MNVTIVGAGLMGSGIAQVCLTGGHDVILLDRNEAALHDAVDQIREIDSLLGIETDETRLKLDGDLDRSAAEAEILIEAVAEDLEVKRAVFNQASRAAGPDTILASNTSAIPISEIATGITGPERFLGTHFWNPPWAVDLVEVVQGARTSAPAIQAMMHFLSDLCMQPVHVRRDVPGFVGNRLQHALKREAIAVVENGICDAETVDTVVKTGFGTRLGVLGPLEQSDLVGLDLTLRIHEVLIPDLDVSREPSALLRRNVAAGNTGMKAGKGFREWTPDGAAKVRQRLHESLAAHGQARVARLESRLPRE